MKPGALLGALGAAAFAALAWTASSGPHLFDAGELVAASAQLGASHPPGQPLHAIVAHAAVLVPLGPIAWRIACVSALFGVLAAVAAARIVLEASPGSTLPALAALVSVPLAPAIAPQLGRPEVYTLALFLALEGTRRLLAWARGDAGGLRVGALCAGLAVAVHPPHALALLAIGAVLLASLRRDVRPRAIAWAALACGVGMLAIAYLPIRAAAGAPMWGDPTSLAGLWDYLSASAYRRNLGTEGGSALGNAVEVIGYVLVPGGLGALLAIVPLRRAEQRRPIAALALAACAAIVAACLQRLEPANPDNVAYAGPAAALFVALGLASVASLGQPRGTAIGQPRAVALGAAALALLGVASGDPAALLQRAPQLESLAFLVVDAPPPRALVIPRTDFVAAAWMEARDVEGARPDVALFVQGLATSSWHWRTLRDHPPFDGTPVRSGPGSGPDPWVRGAIARAQGELPIVVEDDGPLGGRGVVLAPYLMLAPGDRAPDGARVERSFAERVFGGPARMIPLTPAGHGGAAHGVIRDAEIARARRLFARDRAPLALAGLMRASAPLDAAATEPAVGLGGSPVRAPPPVVHDPDAIYATPEDAVRDLAAVLVSLGAVDRAIALLALQAERGDDRATLQLAWLHHALGRPDAARATLDAYRQLHPERADEIGALAAALDRAGAAAPGGSP